MPGSDSVLRSTGSLALPNGTDVAPGGIDNVDAVANNDPAIEAAVGIKAPPGAAAGTVPTPPLPYGPRDWRARIGWVRQSPYFRRSVQCGLGTVVILVVLSPAAVARALTVSTSTSSSAGPPAFCLLNFYLLLLVSNASGQSPLQVGAQQIFGNLFGGALAIAAMYITYGFNGGSYDNTLAKAVTMVLASAVVLFCLTVCRFHFRPYTLLYLFQSITFTMCTASLYHVTTKIYEFTLYWWIYSAIGGSVAFLCATFVLPISAGNIVRRRLAAGLLHSAQVARCALEVMTGEVAPDTGLLAAASGETAERIGLDSGLYPQLAPLYASVISASLSLQDAYMHLAYAPHWLEVYRRQHRFPRHAFRLLSILSRSLLNAIMMCVYPVQTGTLHVSLIARHREQLLALAGALDETCGVLGDVLVQNAPISHALEKLRVLEARYASLAVASRFKGSTVTQDTLALDLVLSLLFTAVTRLRRMMMLLPEALGADQPASLEPVLTHFQAEAEGRASDWSLTALTRIPAAGSGARDDPVELLRASLRAAQPKQGMSSKVLAMLAPPPLLEVPAQEQRRTRWRRARDWLPGKLGVHPRVFALGFQMVAAYTTVLIMLTIPAVNAVFDNSLNWSLFVIVSVLEPSTGGAIFKGAQRLAGTLAAGCLGVALQYFVYLLNGLSYRNTVGKSAAMTACLGLVASGAAAASVKFPRYHYVFTIGVITVALTALPGFNSNTTQPAVALWRAVNNALGVMVELLAVTLVLPVTARQHFKVTMSATLQQLAAVSRTAFEGALPRTLRHTAASKPGLQPAQQPRQRQRRQRWWRQRLGAMAVAEEEEEEEESELDMSEGSGEQQLQEAARADSSTGAHAWQQQQRQQQRLRRRQQGGEAPREGSGRSAGSCSGSQLSASGRPAAIEMQGGPQGFAGLTLPPVRTQPASGQGTPQHPVSVQSPQGRGEQQHAGAGSPAAAAGSPPQSARSWARGQQQPASPLSPRGSSAGAACRRRTGSGSGLTALGPGGGQTPHGQTPRPLHPGMERSQSQQSDVSVHMSIYVSQGRFKVMGTGYASQLPLLRSTSDRIVAMLQLRTALSFEWYPFSTSHRFPFEAGFRSQRLCRHMLNVVAAVPILLDSNDVSALPLLAPFADRLHLLVEQLALCLEAMSGMVQGRQDPPAVVSLVLALEEHVRRLFLAVLAHLADRGNDSSGGSEADIITVLAFIAVVCNAAYVARLLAIALMRTFRPVQAARSEAALLEHPNRWALDDRMLHLFTGILGVAIGSSATGSGGPLTPRNNGMTPRHRPSWEGSRHSVAVSIRAASPQAAGGGGRGGLASDLV